MLHEHRVLTSTQVEYARKRTGHGGRWTRLTVLTWPRFEWRLRGRVAVVVVRVRIAVPFAFRFLGHAMVVRRAGEAVAVVVAMQLDVDGAQDPVPVHVRAMEPVEVEDEVIGKREQSRIPKVIRDDVLRPRAHLVVAELPREVTQLADDAELVVMEQPGRIRRRALDVLIDAQVATQSRSSCSGVSGAIDAGSPAPFGRRGNIARGLRRVHRLG
jgi:hypothetical protein